MRFGYTILYVHDVPKTMAFYKKAFCLQTKFLHESNMYGEMKTGATTLAFAADALSKQNDFTIVPNKLQNPTPGNEIAFVSDDVKDAYTKAIAAGEQPLKEPVQKPWGQTVAYVRDIINGVLIELCSPLE